MKTNKQGFSGITVSYEIQSSVVFMGKQQNQQPLQGVRVCKQARHEE